MTAITLGDVLAVMFGMIIGGCLGAFQLRLIHRAFAPKQVNTLPVKEQYVPFLTAWGKISENILIYAAGCFFVLWMSASPVQPDHLIAIINTPDLTWKGYTLVVVLGCATIFSTLEQLVCVAGSRIGRVANKSLDRLSGRLTS